jgi:hypothetical protein
MKELVSNISASDKSISIELTGETGMEYSKKRSQFYPSSILRHIAFLNLKLGIRIGPTKVLLNLKFSIRIGSTKVLLNLKFSIRIEPIKVQMVIARPCFRTR